ncbi:MAG TPA: LysR family transcriptional regulator [Polyangiaceae bacterium]|nr:LysR family transcriptional regulator [Polyangiaceae bacterium]
MNWDDLRFFLVLSRHRTLSSAARELRVAQPTVGRRISALERRVGAELFVRSSSGFSLTPSGTRALAFAQRMEQDALAAERRLAGRDIGVRGAVSVTASEWLVTGVLAPIIGSLLAIHPELCIELVADTRHLNLSRREADIALRPRRFEQAGIVQRATCKLAFALYATHAYLATHGTPSYGRGAGHTLVAMSDDTGDVARSWLAAALPDAVSSLKTNGRDAMLALARSGAAIACLARVVGDRVPDLQRVTLSPKPPTPRLWLGFHRDARETPRVKAVVTHLAERLRTMAPSLCPED